MGIKQQLLDDVKDAMKEGDNVRRDSIRSLLAAVKQVEIDERKVLDDAAVLSIISKQAKQRRESIVDFEKGGRDRLVAEEKSILAIIESYLPQQMSEVEIRSRAETVIASLGASDPRAMGQVMNALMAELKGRADGKTVSRVVRELLLNA